MVAEEGIHRHLEPGTHIGQRTESSRVIPEEIVSLRMGDDGPHAALTEPLYQFDGVGRIQISIPVELQQGEGMAIAEVTVQAGLEVPAVGARVRDLYLRTREDRQGQFGLCQCLVEAGNVGQDIGEAERRCRWQ